MSHLEGVKVCMIECTYGTAAEHKSNQIVPECEITFETK